MKIERDMMRVVRWPLALLAVAGVAILAAFVLDQTAAREYALVIGGPALTVLLPVGLVWLVLAVVLHGRRTRSSH